VQRGQAGRAALGGARPHGRAVAAAARQSGSAVRPQGRRPADAAARPQRARRVAHRCSSWRRPRWLHPALRATRSGLPAGQRGRGGGGGAGRRPVGRPAPEEGLEAAPAAARRGKHTRRGRRHAARSDAAQRARGVGRPQTPRPRPRRAPLRPRSVPRAPGNPASPDRGRVRAPCRPLAARRGGRSRRGGRVGGRGKLETTQGAATDNWECRQRPRAAFLAGRASARESARAAGPGFGSPARGRSTKLRHYQAS
jgi:hypothetical protein